MGECGEGQVGAEMQQFVSDADSADANHDGRRDGRKGAAVDKADQHGTEEQDEARRVSGGEPASRWGFVFAAEACTFSTDSECLVLESRGFAVVQSGRYRNDRKDGSGRDPHRAENAYTWRDGSKWHNDSHGTGPLPAALPRQFLKC